MTPQANTGALGTLTEMLSKSRLGRWVLGAAGVGVALTYSDNIVKSAIGATSAAGGPGGVNSNATENMAQTTLFAGTVTGVRNLFVGIMEFVKLVKDIVTGELPISDILSGKTSASEMFSSAYSRAKEPAATQPAPATAAAAPTAAPSTGIVEQAVNFGHGLYEEATDLNNFTVDNATNVGRSALRGVFSGAAYLGSMAYANTVGLVTGATTSETHDTYVQPVIDGAMEATVGLPEVKGHFSQAAEGIGELLVPGKLALGAASLVGRAFTMSRFATGTTAAAASTVLGPEISGP